MAASCESELQKLLCQQIEQVIEDQDLLQRTHETRKQEILAKAEDAKMEEAARKERERLEIEKEAELCKQQETEKRQRQVEAKMQAALERQMEQEKAEQLRIDKLEQQERRAQREADLLDKAKEARLLRLKHIEILKAEAEQAQSINTSIADQNRSVNEGSPILENAAEAKSAICNLPLVTDAIPAEAIAYPTASGLNELIDSSTEEPASTTNRVKPCSPVSDHQGKPISLNSTDPQQEQIAQQRETTPSLSMTEQSYGADTPLNSHDEPLVQQKKDLLSTEQPDSLTTAKLCQIVTQEIQGADDNMELPACDIVGLEADAPQSLASDDEDLISPVRKYVDATEARPDVADTQHHSPLPFETLCRTASQTPRHLNPLLQSLVRVRSNAKTGQDGQKSPIMAEFAPARLNAAFQVPAEELVSLANQSEEEEAFAEGEQADKDMVKLDQEKMYIEAQKMAQKEERQRAKKFFREMRQ